MAEQSKTEQWRIIKGFPDYAVSNFGKVKRLVSCKFNQHKAGYMLKPQKVKNYKQIHLTTKKIRKFCKIHHLVLEAFVNPRPEGKQCNHKDGNKSNNYFENLEWVTASENMKHSYDVLGHIGAKGKKSGMAKLTTENIYRIRELFATGKYTQKQIAQRFNVVRQTISSVVNRISWNHI